MQDCWSILKHSGLCHRSGARQAALNRAHEVLKVIGACRHSVLRPSMNKSKRGNPLGCVQGNGRRRSENVRLTLDSKKYQIFFFISRRKILEKAGDV